MRTLIGITFLLFCLIGDAYGKPISSVAVCTVLPKGCNYRQVEAFLKEQQKKGINTAYLYYHPNESLLNLEHRAKLIEFFGDLSRPLNLIEWPYKDEALAYEKAIEHVTTITRPQIKEVMCTPFNAPDEGVRMEIERKKRWEISVTTLFNQETKWFKEWIEYHRMLGVEHFFLFNNNNDDAYFAELEPYIREGCVTLFSWYVKDFFKAQKSANNHALKFTKKRSKWLAIIDVDEFFVPKQHDTLNEFLIDYEDVGGVFVNWIFFGTSWVKEIPEDQLLIEALTLTSLSSDPQHRWGKSILRPTRVKKMYDTHIGIYRKGYFDVLTDGKKRNSRQVGFHDKIQLNHYTLRDQKFFHEVKVARLQKFYQKRLSKKDVKELEAKYNHNPNDAIFRFIPTLRERFRNCCQVRVLLRNSPLRRGSSDEYCNKTVSISRLSNVANRILPD